MLPDISHFDFSALGWRPMTQGEFDDLCEFDGDLADRWEVVSPEKVQTAPLPVTPEQAAALRSFDHAMIDGFNVLDIQIKERFEVSVVIFIDYDEGTARLAKPASFPLPVTAATLANN